MRASAIAMEILNSVSFSSIGVGRTRINKAVKVLSSSTDFFFVQKKISTSAVIMLPEENKIEITYIV